MARSPSRAKARITTSVYFGNKTKMVAAMPMPGGHVYFRNLGGQLFSCVLYISYLRHDYNSVVYWCSQLAISNTCNILVLVAILILSRLLQTHRGASPGHTSTCQTVIISTGSSCGHEISDRDAGAYTKVHSPVTRVYSSTRLKNVAYIRLAASASHVAIKLLIMCLFCRIYHILSNPG